MLLIFQLQLLFCKLMVYHTRNATVILCKLITPFIFINKCYGQRDKVSMDSLLGTVSASIIMAKTEDKVIKKVVDDGSSNFAILQF